MVETSRIPSIRTYHQRSKHTPHRSAAGPGFLDWDNQPDPFRHFDGARRIDLPLDLDRTTGSFAAPGGGSPTPLDLRGLGRFLELALGLSAWKQYGGSRWALRNNPSSGNLHPTEGWLVLPPLDGFSARSALYHYSPLLHGLEERCVWPGPSGCPHGAFLFALSSVPWREAWKYGERAFRYCQHDTGHALAAAAYAGACLGWRVQALTAPGDRFLADLLGIGRADANHPHEAEHPELGALVWYDPPAGAAGREEPAPEAAWESLRMIPDAEWHGRANRLSPDLVDWLANDRAFELTAKPETPSPSVRAGVPAAVLAPSLADDAATVIRRRRSAQRMDPRIMMSRSACLQMLAQTMPGADRVPWAAFPWAPRLSLFLFVHRVVGLASGLYALVRDPEAQPRLRQACHRHFLWQSVPDCPLPLFLLYPGELSGLAASLSCGQDIAGDGVLSLAMVADFDRTLADEGDWAYRRLFWESGMIGQVLYLEATAAGLSGTGIGCYFDDEVHAALGLDRGATEWQSLYHFAVGRAVEDARISSAPAYEHLRMSRR